MKKTLSLLLALLMLVAAFAACGPKSEKDPGKEALQNAHGVFRTFLNKSPTSLNTFVDTDIPAGTITSYCMAWLYNDRPTNDGEGWEWYCELAEEFPQQVDEEGKVWRIKMRSDLKWANGEPISIDDWIYSMQMLCDPIQVNVSSSGYASSIYMPIENLYEYSKGECAWEDVGIKKIDDLTMDLISKIKVPQINVMRFTGLKMVYRPYYEGGMNEDRSCTNYGTSIDTYMSCGPFKLVEWYPDAKFTLTRNEYYPLQENISIEGMEIKIIPDAETQLQLFLNGELDYCSVNYSTWEQFEDDPRVYEFFNDSLMYMFVNLGNPSQNNILGNLDYRQALNHGFDRIEIANTLGVYPVSRYVRRSVIGNNLTGKPFVDYPADYLPDPATLFDVALAKEYLAKAFEAKGLESTTLEFLQSESATFIKAVNEMLQKQYDINFEGKIKANIRQVPTTLTLRRWNPDDPTSYEISIGSMLPSAIDPRASFRVFISSYNPPRVKWENKEFDALYDKSLELDLYDENEAEEIVRLCQQMEKMMLDDLVVIPVYEKPDKVLYSERIHLPVSHYIVGFGFGEKYMTID